jgi:hypothetical protein
VQFHIPSGKSLGFLKKKKTMSDKQDAIYSTSMNHNKDILGLQK